MSKGAGGDGAHDDFLARERAALGDDADQFGSAPTTLQAADDDLLGGGDGGTYGGNQTGGEEISEFESSFPAMDTQNTVTGDLTDDEFWRALSS